jgi:hypothetical protein
MGTLAKPFQTIAAAVAVAAAGNGRIFVVSGTYSGSITLLAGQQLIGQGVSVASATSFDALFGISPPSGSAARPVIGGTRPILTTAAGDAITLGTDDTIRGLEIGNTAGVGIVGANFGTLTLGDNVISGAGQALSLSTGTLAQASARKRVRFDHLHQRQQQHSVVGCWGKRQLRNRRAVGRDRYGLPVQYGDGDPQLRGLDQQDKRRSPDRHRRCGCCQFDLEW